MRVLGQVRQVVWQDEQRLEQREQEYRNHHERNELQELSDHPRDEKKWRERRDRRQDRERDRNGDPLRSLYRRLQRPGPLFPSLEDVLAHHDGVIDHDADRENEGEQGHHVDRDAEPRHHGKCADERQRDPDGHPPRKAQVEEQRQGDEDQDQPDEPVLAKQVESTPEEIPVVLPDLDVDPPGHRRYRHIGQVRLHHVHDLGYLLVGGAEHLDERRGVTVVEGCQVRVLETVVDRGDLVQAERGAIAGPTYDDLRRSRAGRTSPLHPDQDFLVRRVHPPTRQIETGPTDGQGHLVEAEAVGAKRIVGDLDRDLVVADACDLHVGNLGHRGQVVLDPVRQLFESPFRGVAGHRDLDDPATASHLRDFRLLGIRREAGDPVHFGLDFVQALARILAQVQLDEHDSNALGGRGVDLAHALDRLDPLLDALDDPFLDLLG